MAVVALWGSGIVVATSAAAPVQAAGPEGVPGTAYVTNYLDGTVSVITTD